MVKNIKFILCLVIFGFMYKVHDFSLLPSSLYCKITKTKRSRATERSIGPGRDGSHYRLPVPVKQRQTEDRAQQEKRRKKKKEEQYGPTTKKSKGTRKVTQ